MPKITPDQEQLLSIYIVYKGSTDNLVHIRNVEIHS